MSARVSRRGFFAALVKRPADPPPPPPPKAVPGVIPAGEVFSLEAFYAARKPAKGAPR